MWAFCIFASSVHNDLAHKLHSSEVFDLLHVSVHDSHWKGGTAFTDKDRDFILLAV